MVVTKKLCPSLSSVKSLEKCQIRGKKKYGSLLRESINEGTAWNWISIASQYNPVDHTVAGIHPQEHHANPEDGGGACSCHRSGDIQQPVSLHLLSAPSCSSRLSLGTYSCITEARDTETRAQTKHQEIQIQWTHLIMLHPVALQTMPFSLFRVGCVLWPPHQKWGKTHSWETTSQTSANVRAASSVSSI